MFAAKEAEVTFGELVSAIFDLMREAGEFGTEVVIPENEVPYAMQRMYWPSGGYSSPKFGEAARKRLAGL